MMRNVSSPSCSSRNRRQRVVFLNSRFRAQPEATGVGRYAAELAALYEFTELTPPRCLAGPNLGFLWEQMWLPLRTFGRTLVSPGNSGPFAKRRHLVIFHDLAPLRHPEHFSRAYRWKFSTSVRVLARTASGFGTVSETIAREIRAELGRSAYVIPNVVRPAVVTETLQQERPYFLVIGASDPRKRADLVCRAFTSSASLRTRFDLLLTGGKRAYLQAADQNDAEPHPAIRPVGYLDDPLLATTLAGALALVYVPEYEGFGRPPIEAMRMGVPVIASDIAVLRETCGENAVFVDPTTASALATSMEQLADDAPRRAELSAGGRAWAEQWTADRTRAAIVAALAGLSVADGNVPATRRP